MFYSNSIIIIIISFQPDGPGELMSYIVSAMLGHWNMNCISIKFINIIL